MRVLLRLLGFLRLRLPQVALTVLLGVATVASNVGLLATAAYVISAAVLVPFLGAQEYRSASPVSSAFLGPAHATPSVWSPTT